jgi:N-acetylmuramoyl-L-alanine amidase
LPSAKKPKQPRKPTIVLDPGHGGKDPGAIGYKKLKEKDLVLDVALRVGKLLSKKGARVIYTRKSDQYLSLEERTLIANREEADLFVSIHANSARNRDAFGFETYYLSAAFDHASRILAARENAMSPESMGELEELLLTLELTSRKQSSQIFAHSVQKAVLNTLNSSTSYSLRNLGVKGAPFYVLIGSRMPAVLVEIGFVTNPKEAKRLMDPNYRQKLAQGIATGIWKYWEQQDKIPL